MNGEKIGIARVHVVGKQCPMFPNTNIGFFLLFLDYNKLGYLDIAAP